MAKNINIVNAIINDASPEFKSRFPLATQQTLAETGTAITENTQDRNEFLSSMMNRITKVYIKNRLYKNPLAKFKKDMQEWGNTIEEVFVDLIEAIPFDQEDAEQTLFKRNLPDVNTVFHKINREDQYPVTISQKQLKRAFLNPNGLQSLVDGIVKALYTSDANDEFLAMKGLFHKFRTEGKFYVVNVISPTDEDSAKAVVTKMKEVSDNLTLFLSPTYNHAGVHNLIPKEDLEVFLNTKFNAILDVEVLAKAFNMEKTELMGRQTLLNDFGGADDTDVIGVISSKEWFMCFDNLIDMEMVYNPKGKYTNFFFNHWQTLSVSNFEPAVIFTTIVPTLTAIDLLPATATAKAGDSVQTSVVTTGTGNPPSKCTYEHDGTDPYTYISVTGLLTIGKNETSTPITITATSTFDEAITDTAIITVT